MDINEIDDIEDLMDETPEDSPEIPSIDEIDEPDEGQYGEEEDEYSVIERFLTDHGVDPRSIKFETEEGEETSDFNDLSSDDQYQILNSLSEDETDLDDSEIGLLNFMRTNNWSVQDYNNYIAQQAIQRYSQEQTEPEQTYQIDDLSDEELFLVDLKSKIPDLTEEEAMEELDRSQQNQDLFNKKVQSLRKDYKEKEDLYKKQQEEEKQNQQKAAYEQYSKTIADAINRATVMDLGDLDLELQNQDKQEIYNYLVGYDQQGNRLINNTLADPDQLVRMAWLNIKGPEVFKELTSYYKKKISDVAKTNYQKGYEDAKGGRSYNQAKSVVKKRRQTKQSGELSINDIDDFLD